MKKIHLVVEWAFGISMLLMTASQWGCYSFSRGEFVGHRFIPGSETVGSETYEVAQVHSPDLDDHRFEIRLTKRTNSSLTGIRRYEEIATVGSFRKVLGMLVPPFWGLLYWQIIPLWHRDWTAPALPAETWTTRVYDGKTYKYWKSKQGWEYSEVTSDTLEEETEKIPRLSDPIPVQGVAVELQTLGRTKTVVSDATGICTVDAISGLGLTKFGDLSPVLLRCHVSSMNLDREFQLYPREWTRPHVRITKDKVKITDVSGGVVKVLGTALKGEEFAVEFETGEVIKVRKGLIVGYISKEGVERFWAASGYLNASR